jgi:hypothetical protein
LYMYISPSWIDSTLDTAHHPNYQPTCYNIHHSPKTSSHPLLVRSWDFT